MVTAANLRASISKLDAAALVTAAFILAFNCLLEENQAIASGF
jgi:hypothetical protein